MFGKKDPKDIIRESRRGIDKSARELERELGRLKIEEQKTIQQIKLAAKQGNDATTRVLAKSLVRLRQQMTKLTAGRAQLKGVSTQMMAVGASHTVGTAMKSATKAMESVGKAAEIEKMPQTLAQFMKQNEKMEMAQEVMEDAVEMAFDTEDTETETDDVMNQVLDEIGIDLSSELSKAAAPRTRLAAKPNKASAEEESQTEDDLARRLGGLKS